jgi:V/A-type H+-transporting ATPase subunit A
LGSANGERRGSVTVVGAVSPPGGDFSEPVTQNSMRAAGTFWGLDYDLSRRRHFPAINWTQSYTLYRFDGDRPDVPEEWDDLVRSARLLLRQEAGLLEIVQLVGPDALSETERLVLFSARLLREDFLQQSAVHPVDRYCPPEKSHGILQAVLSFHRAAEAALLAEVPLERITALPVLDGIARAKELAVETAAADLRALNDKILESFEGLTRMEPI